jgi:hypothetical protein
LFAQLGEAADALQFFKNYFVTGDVALAGVGLRSSGVNGFATGTINMNGVPCTGGSPVAIVPCSTPGSVPADVVAAFLYWEAEENTATPLAANGFFDFDRNGNPNPIEGKVLGDPNNPACFSSGGTSGSNNVKGRVYRADVRRLLHVDPTSKVRLANGPHTVTLPESGGNGNGNIILTNGATLVVVYRIVVPGNPGIVPLRAVVSYDGAHTLDKSSPPMTQTSGGFYQAAASAAAKMIPIVANGQSDFFETLTVDGAAIGGTQPFRGTAGPRWDNPTFNINLAQNAASYSTQVTAGTNQACLTFAAIWTSTGVTDTDRDGLLDKWEQNGLHLNPGGPAQPATFGGCPRLDPTIPASEPCVDLPRMGADAAKKDIFVEIDWLRGIDGHLHVPKLSALKPVAETFRGHEIYVHFDVGDPTALDSVYGSNYLRYSSSYMESGSAHPAFIVPAGYARGGNVIDESDLTCPSTEPSCTYPQFSDSVIGWKKGFLSLKNGLNGLGIPALFDPIRKDIFHYALFAHALGGPFNSHGVPLDTNPRGFSGVGDRPGPDFMLTFGLWRFDDPPGCNPTDTCADQTGSSLVQAGTFMHELGHNLGLSHAGWYKTPNCMPNYQSVMNYLYQVRGLTDGLGFEHIDYSSGSLSPLKENSLSETASMGSLNYRVRFYGPSADGAATKHCDGTAIGAGEPPLARLQSPGLSTPNWNNNGSPNEAGPLSVDVNFSGSLPDGVDVAAGKYFLDSPDWSSLNLQQISAARNVNGLSAGVGEDDLGVGEDDLGVGEDDLGVGEDDLGVGEDDLGVGEDDLGDVEYGTVISSLDPTSSEHPLTATSDLFKITLTWGFDGIGQFRFVDVYRSDSANPTPSRIATLSGAPPATTYNDAVNSTTTLYNTNYTYFIRSGDNQVPPVISPPSSTVIGIVKHLFIAAKDKSRVYGDPNPLLDFTTTGMDPGLSGTTTCTTTATSSSNVGNYPITCSGRTPAAGVTYTPGTLTITGRPITVRAATNTKTYDGTTSAAAKPTITSGTLASGQTGMFSETYDNPNTGINKTLTPTGTVRDSSGDVTANYTITFVPDTTGVILPGFVFTGSMVAERSFHTATLLNSGKVLVAGGFDTNGAPLATAELYDPVAKTFSLTANNMPNKAAGHTATLLLNGKVLVVGGGNSSTQIYDPATNTWSSAGGSGQRTYHTATRLPNGKVLIAGGSDNSGKTTNTALLYDPATGSYTDTGSMTASRDFHTATLLLNGKVLIAGGRTGNGSSYTYLSSAELYDSATGVFTAVGSSMSSARFAHSAVLVNGRVLIAGGANSTALTTANWYDPTAGTFSVTGSLTTARQYFTATLLGNTVVEAGGLNTSGRLLSAEWYQGSVFQSIGNMKAPRAAHTATQLNDGSVLITGGQGSSGTSVKTAELMR